MNVYVCMHFLRRVFKLLQNPSFILLCIPYVYIFFFIHFWIYNYTFFIIILTTSRPLQSYSLPTVFVLPVVIWNFNQPIVKKKFYRRFNFLRIYTYITYIHVFVVCCLVVFLLLCKYTLPIVRITNNKIKY